PGPDRGRGGPRRRGAGHAPGDEHRPRRLAHHRARQLPAGLGLPPGNHGPDGGDGPARAGHPGADRLGRRPDHPSQPDAGRQPPRHPHHRGHGYGGGRGHPPGPVPVRVPGWDRRVRPAGGAAARHRPAAQFPRPARRPRCHRADLCLRAPRERLVTGVRRLAALAGLLAAPLLAPAPALAPPDASVTVLSQEPGLVRVELVVGALPDGDELDLSSVSVRAGDTPLEVREVLEAETRATEVAPVQRRLAVLVIDVSDSMVGQHLADAIAAARRYADELPDDVDLAVVTAGAAARTVLAPTGDRGVAHRVLGELATEGSTALYDGLMAAADLAADAGRYAERRVLVLSDGADSSSATSLPDLERRLAEVGVPVDTVAFRTEVAVADLLAALSSRTGGRAYEAADAEGLAGAFERAARSFTLRLVVEVLVPVELSAAAADLAVSVQAGQQDR